MSRTVWLPVLGFLEYLYSLVHDLQSDSRLRQRSSCSTPQFSLLVYLLTGLKRPSAILPESPCPAPTRRLNSGAPRDDRDPPQFYFIFAYAGIHERP